MRESSIRSPEGVLYAASTLVVFTGIMAVVPHFTFVSQFILRLAGPNLSNLNHTFPS
jgi:hypothetical protein